MSKDAFQTKFIIEESDGVTKKEITQKKLDEISNSKKEKLKLINEYFEDGVNYKVYKVLKKLED